MIVVALGCGRAEKRSESVATSAERAPSEKPEAYATPTPGPNAGAPGTPIAPSGPGPVDVATPTPAGDPGLAASAPGTVVVIATIADAGPIGDGRCSQRSYQLAIGKTLTGSAPTSPVWAHFEQCGPRTTEPAAGNLAGTSLATGTTYRFTLARGASKNFGDGLVIVDARVP